MNKIFFAVILVLVFVQADSSMKWAIGKTLVHSATIIHHLRRIVSMLRQTPKETAVDASIQAVSAGIAITIDRYIDAIENGNEITDSIGHIVNYFPIRCRIYHNQFDMDLEDFNLEFFFSKVKQYSGFYREVICFKDGKGTRVKIQNGDESAMAVILVHSIKNDRFVKLFTRC